MMDGLRYSNLIIGLISLIISYTVLKLFKKNKIIINVSVIILLIIISLLIDLNEIMQVIFGSVFGATLISTFDLFNKWYFLIESFNKIINMRFNETL